MTNKITKHSTVLADETVPLVVGTNLSRAEIKTFCAWYKDIMSHTRYKIIYHDGVPTMVPVSEKEIGIVQCNTTPRVYITVNCHLVKCVRDIDCPLRGNNETRKRTVARYLTDLSKMFIVGYGVGDEHSDVSTDPSDEQIENVIGDRMWNREDFTGYPNLTSWCDAHYYKTLVWWEGSVNGDEFSYLGWED